MNGFKRPWHVGVLWNDDPRLPEPLLAELRRDPRWWSATTSLIRRAHSYEYTLTAHARTRGPAALLAGSAAGPDRHARQRPRLGRRLAPAIRAAVAKALA